MSDINESKFGKLTGKQIKERLEQSKKNIFNNESSNCDLIINPILDDKQFQGCKIDVRLDNLFYIIKHNFQGCFDPTIKNTNYLAEIKIRYGDAFVLHPGDFILAPIFESIQVPVDLEGSLDGRSSLGRLGITVHSTAGSIDPGFTGTIILELENNGPLPILLYPLMRVAAISFSLLLENVDSYRKEGKYAKKCISVESRIYDDKDLWKIKLFKDNY